MMATGRHHLCKSDSILVARIEQTVPALAAARRFLDCFTAMVRNGEDAAMSDWLEEAKASELAPFARGLITDLDAVTAAFREPFQRPDREEQINRLKLLKRQMSGAAGIDLLLSRLQHFA